MSSTKNQTGTIIPMMAIASSRRTYQLAVVILISISSSSSSSSSSMRWWRTSSITATAFTPASPVPIIRSTTSSVSNVFLPQVGWSRYNDQTTNHGFIPIRPSMETKMTMTRVASSTISAPSLKSNRNSRKLSSLSFWKNLTRNIKSPSIFPSHYSSRSAKTTSYTASTAAAAASRTTTPNAVTVSLRKRLTHIYKRFLVPIMITVLGIGSSLRMATKPAFAMAVGGGAAGIARKPMKK